MEKVGQMGFHSSVCKRAVQIGYLESLNGGERLSHVQEVECKVRAVCSGFGTLFLARGIGSEGEKSLFISWCLNVVWNSPYRFFSFCYGAGFASSFT